MWLAAIVAWLHYCTFALGVAALFVRGRAMHSSAPDQMKVLFAADTAWGLSALLWITTGVARLLWLEKSTGFYLHNGLFYVKMGLFLLVFALEVRPMLAFIGWRILVKRGATPETKSLALYQRLNDLELALVVLIALVATLMARGVWLF